MQLDGLTDGYYVSKYEKDLFEERYQNPGDKSETTWEQVFQRVATTVSEGDAEKAERWYKGMSGGQFIPSSPQLWNYGANRRFSRNGSSCFTGRMGDTLADFREADADAEAIYVASGGYGLCANDVRPRGCKIKHCSEGAMGSMCYGGPIRRIEGTTGYITGSGRARGALMVQQSIWHIDIIEFILAKRPQALAWLDDWPVNAKAKVWNTDEWDASPFIDAFTANFVHVKDWPTYDEVSAKIGGDWHLNRAIAENIVSVVKGRVVPMVHDFGTGVRRPANRDWNLPMQNCNMSVRCPDEFMEAVEMDLAYPLRWESKERTGPGEQTWLKTDVNGELREIYGDISVVDRTTGKAWAVESPSGPRYSMLITTWEGIRANMSPNKNMWRDTDYARFYRTVVMPAIGHLSGPITARQLWGLICENAHNHADPGVVFESTYERFCPVDTTVYGPRHSNPCSEYVAPAGGSCDLASVNCRMAAEDDVCIGFIRDSGAWFLSGAETQDDWEFIRDSNAFAAYIDAIGASAKLTYEYIQHALDYNVAPVPFIHEISSQHFRDVGIGIMGAAEALMVFHIRYGSICAQRFIEATMSEVILTAWEESFRMVNSGDTTAPLAWDRNRMAKIFSERLGFACDHGLEDHISRWKTLVERVRRGEKAGNCNVGSIAPTGTIAQIAKWLATRAALRAGNIRKKEISGGIEPAFDWGVFRQDSSGVDQNYHDLWFDDEHHGKPWMVTAMNGVTPVEHVLMQASACKFTCMSVSKTINLPNDATVSDVSDTYLLAWSSGIPGTSLYRDGSKPMQVLTALECPSGECKIDYSTLLRQQETTP